MAANVESGRTGASEWSGGDHPTESPTAVSKPAEIRIEEQAVVAHREEEEEEEAAESDLDAEYDDEIESEFEDFETLSHSPTDAKEAHKPLAPRSLVSQPPIHRKRSHDEASEEEELQEFSVNVPEREGTPPKRARLDDGHQGKLSAPLVDSPPLRQRKRSSEELEDDPQRPELQSPKRVKA